MPTGTDRALRDKIDTPNGQVLANAAEIVHNPGRNVP